MTKIDLPQPILDQAVQIMRRPASLETAAAEMSIGITPLRRNLIQAGMLKEFAGRKLSGVNPDNSGNPARHLWDEAIANKYLVMKLRQQA